MAAQFGLREPEAVAEKVLRRAQVSKMTRALQDRLALASVKIQNGWENMSLDAIEPQLESRRMRKRPASSNDTVSDTASTTSSIVHSSLASSPLTAPMFSDDIPRSGSNKRPRPAQAQRGASSGAMRSGARTRMATRSTSWKSQHSLPESSPIDHAKHARYPSNNISHLSFISEGSTVPDSPPSPVHSEDDDADIPVTSFSLNASTRIISLTSSPPHTPPPDRRMKKAHNVSWSRTPKHGDDGADLLMFLATSPSPAIKRGDVHHTNMIVQPPSTPPCKPTPLPSSHMTPSTNAGFLGFGPHTPGTNFNFADFVNVTPSPAQGPWTRTPNAGAGRTPAAAREARRKLNFDALLPPTSGPVLTRSSSKNGGGLGMELGGELMS
ncbi:hypothetical protein B0A55_12238 [Friedmanniomyces simplex]|uniref:Uncharacterized protein n=1 Tax=Friedmanniomyces simplex TaxID=329884 RepID=A0A4U0WPD2_9PEZI|nr:hypothetical protein B0A55_12238 [Friedmanniomyces simplex]